jgi:RNA recognition motif-containing protein
VPEDAERAVNEKQSARWKGRTLNVELANQRQPLKLRTGERCAPPPPVAAPPAVARR